ncbi:hypothetical protein UFOVP453_22 [uncultured Caudovirales phage]|uniref:Uncharacterized protein n=1 Tax=uncultured Caudovirales phage TaxID=2100421 RepID=A0A6J5MFQ2_9CAUD|nr:hypothetical protein UFOVP453_22 [uncultured Caudovirales phage]
MRAILILMFFAAFIMLCVHVIKTDVSIEEMERIENEAIQFAKYCYENDYTPEECR